MWSALLTLTYPFRLFCITKDESEANVTTPTPINTRQAAAARRPDTRTALAQPVVPQEQAQEALPAAPRPTTLDEAHAGLCKPFAQSLIELKPGATTHDKKRALATPYVDLRAYQTRLDRIVGPAGWSVEYRAHGDRAVICRLTILGVVREDVGECSPADENAATSAVAQAFKRTCAAFGLGRYLYSLPAIWGDYDPDRKCLKNIPAIVAEMYQGIVTE